MRNTGRWLVIGVALVLWPLVPAYAAPVLYQGQDPRAGYLVFGAKGCVKCHSIKGVGGKVGPDLGRIPRPRSFYDLATAMWNHLPRMVDRMQRLGISRPKLDAREAGDVIAFLYTLNYFDPPGDPGAGRRLFSEKRCIVCHTVGKTGGAVGPNLDFLKQFGSPIVVATAMWNHGPAMIEKMRAKGVERPSFTGRELSDLIAYLAPSASRPEEGPVYVLPGRASEGRLLFVGKHCIECHSVGGQGGRVGPDLVGLGVRRSLLEYAALMWNKAPKMIAAMTPRGIEVPQLTPEDMADIIAYLYSVRYFADPGNIQQGWVVATYKGCLQCHGVYGERGKIASDLSQARGLESPGAVIAALWNHAVVTPPVPPQPGQSTGWPEFRPEEMADLVALLHYLWWPR